MEAKWVGFLSDKERGEIGQYDTFGCRAQYYRKAFNLRAQPIKGVLKISALGYLLVYINGKRVSDEYFAPGWTDYNKTILYRMYDISHLLGMKNGIAVCVGEGWYAGHISQPGRCVYGKHPLELFVELTVMYADGSEQTIITDESWLAGLGAIGENDFIGGEIYDSRLPDADKISLYEFDDSGWENVYETKDKSSKLKYFDYEPVVLSETISCEKISQNCNVSLYDLKQNFAGVITIRAKGPSGARIKLRHGEMLAEDGSLYVENLRRAKATDVLILNGEEVEYTPTMTYHGFRYVEVTIDEGVEIVSLVGRALHNDLAQTGNILTSNSLVNRIYMNTLWSMRSNFIDLPTDCPQRNERLGWSGDAQVFCRTAMYLMDCEKFFKKHIECIDDAREGGVIPNIIPYFGVSAKDCTGWRDIAAVLPFTLWEFYADKEYARKCLPILDDMLDLQRTTANDYIWEHTAYNDWLNVDSPMDPAVLATLCNAYCTMLAVKLKKDIGVDFARDIELFENIKRSFIKKFVSGSGDIKGGTQTAYAMAYMVGFIDKQTAREHLVQEFEKRNNHIHSGFLGIRFVLPALCEVGLSDLAYELITKTTYPSWGYSIVNGATTMWERWDSYTKEKGFQDPSMNSFNHYCYGSCGEWYYEYMLGIKPLQAGFKRVQIRPFIDRRGIVTEVKGSFKSRSGEIFVEWRKTGDGFLCVVEKPKSMEAEFVFENVKSIEQDGKRVAAFQPLAEKTVIELE